MTLARISAVLVCAACIALLAFLPAKAEKRVIIRRDTERTVSSLAYPQFGHVRLDAALAFFAAQELERRTQDIEREFDQAALGRSKLASLAGSYALFRPSPQAVSVLFELHATSPRWPAPRRYFSTRSYRLPTGEELTLAGLFESLPDALKILARKCSPKLLAQIMEYDTQERIETAWFLRSRLIMPGHPMPDGADIAEFSKHGGDAPAMRLLEGVVRGTRPEEENFKHFVLTAKGVRIQFEPLQLGGPEAGAPHVDLSLQELQQAKPHMHLWGK
ncbi:MAG: hypothetical protein LBI88_05350 [Deltaproteobacteria bacterium]|jgi:hypothetical protein|nr:hypothetical protein [Deltaproteobacteria bacterium]